MKKDNVKRCLIARKQLHKVRLLFIVFACLLSGFSSGLHAQESYGKTLNLGLGLGGYAGYYRYTDRTLAVFHADYELDVARNFTLAPFVSVHSHNRTYYWGNNNRPHQYYNYRETVIPIGVKGFLYLDQWVSAGSDWDFYLGASLGFAAVISRWDNGYDGDRDVYRAPLLFLDIHAGVEYHISPRTGVFLDISSGVSTIGLAIHSKT
jgi:hypothetical protein